MGANPTLAEIDTIYADARATQFDGVVIMINE
jgi:hypothetical protein